jgi:hypothetical protein
MCMIQSIALNYAHLLASAAALAPFLLASFTRAYVAAVSAHNVVSAATAGSVPPSMPRFHRVLVQARFNLQSSKVCEDGFNFPRSLRAKSLVQGSTCRKAPATMSRLMAVTMTVTLAPAAGAQRRGTNIAVDAGRCVCTCACTLCALFLSNFELYRPHGGSSDRCMQPCMHAHDASWRGRVHAT